MRIGNSNILHIELDYGASMNHGVTTEALKDCKRDMPGREFIIKRATFYKDNKPLKVMGYVINEVVVD